MNTLQSQLVLPRVNGLYRSVGAAPAPLRDAAESHRFDLADYLLLIGIALVPFVAPMPGAEATKPSGWTERLSICDGFFVLAMLLAAWQRFRAELAVWLNRRPRGFSNIALGVPQTWALPPTSPIWFCTAALLVVMVLSWFANPLMPINVHMVAALAVQVYLAVLAVMIASAVCRYGSPAPILVAWVVGFSLLSVLALYDSAAMIAGRHMLYPGAEDRLRGPFRTSAQLAGYSLTSFFLLLAAARFLPWRRWVSKAGILAGIAPLFIVLASRRSVVVSLLAGYIAMLIISKKRVRILLGTIIPMIIVAVVFLLFAPQEMKDYIARRAAPLLGQDERRVDIAVDHFYRGLSAFKEHPVMGVGFGAFSDTRYGELTETIKHEQHSGYIAILAETGLIGFSLLMLLHVAVLERLIRVLKIAAPRYHDLAVYLIVVLVALGVSEVYNRIWRERGLWIIAGMVAALPLLAQKDRLAQARSLSRFAAWKRITPPKPHRV